MTEISELKFKNLKIKEELLKLRGFAAHVEDQNVNLISENDELKKKLEMYVYFAVLDKTFYKNFKETYGSFQINSERHRSLERESLELHDGLARCVAECLISKDKIRELKKENSSFQLQIKDLKKEVSCTIFNVD